MSGLSRTPGKRVRVNSPPRVRIPLSPPNQNATLAVAFAFDHAPGLPLPMSVMAVPISAATSVMLPGTIMVLFFWASCP